MDDYKSLEDYDQVAWFEACKLLQPEMTHEEFVVFREWILYKCEPSKGSLN